MIKISLIVKNNKYIENKHINIINSIYSIDYYQYYCHNSDFWKTFVLYIKKTQISLITNFNYFFVVRFVIINILSILIIY
jgi:hypothetical protein